MKPYLIRKSRENSTWRAYRYVADYGYVLMGATASWSKALKLVEYRELWPSGRVYKPLQY